MADQHRIPQLDGLRGVAALVVVLFHFLLAFQPSLVPDPLALAAGENPAETLRSFWLADLPIGILFNGSFAVSVFFVLSGFVVSNAAANSSTPVYLNMPFRYLRLSIPATASVILAWALLKSFPNEVRSLNVVLPHDWLELVYQSPIPSLSFAVADGLLDVFKDGFSNFNNVLWTMKIELFGSLMIYFVYGLLKSRWRLAALAVVGVSCVLFYPLRIYLGFALGVGLREVAVSKTQARYAPAACVIGILLGFPAHGFARRMLGLDHLPGTLSIGDHTSLIAPIAALLIVYGALYWNQAVRFLTIAPIQFLGRISFPLYLVHVPILFTVATAIYLETSSSGITKALLFLVFLFFSMGTAYLFEISIDAPLLAVLSHLRLGWRHRASRPQGASVVEA